MSQVTEARVRRVRADRTNPLIATAVVEVAALLFKAIAAGVKHIQQRPEAAVASSAKAPAVVEPIRAIQREFQTIAAGAPMVSKTNETAIACLANDVVRASADPIGRDRAIDTLRAAVTSDHQSIVVATTLLAVKNSLSEMAFTEVIVRPDGYILAGQGNNGPQIRADVIKCDDGGVSLLLDTEGFKGNTCQEALGELESRLRDKGVELETSFRRSKQRRAFAFTHLAVRRG